jgi:hypothetical protein
LANEHRHNENQERDDGFIDGSFVPARMGGSEIGFGRKGKATTMMAIVATILIVVELFPAKIEPLN